MYRFSLLSVYYYLKPFLLFLFYVYTCSFIHCTVHVGDANLSTQAFIVDKLQSSAIDLHKAFTGNALPWQQLYLTCFESVGLTDSLNSKVTMEYQLPFASEVK